MAYAKGREIKNDVLTPRWFGTKTSMLHAFTIPAGKPLEGDANGRVKSACGVSVKVANIGAGEATGTKRCPKCSEIFAERKGKNNAHLTERRPEPVQTGLRSGDTAAAERKRAQEVKEISEGKRAVPTARMRPQGPGDVGVSDGPGLTKGAPIMGSATPKMWRNPATGNLEPSSRGYMADGIPPHPKADREIVGPREVIVTNRGPEGGSRRTHGRNKRRARQRQTMRAMRDNAAK